MRVRTVVFLATLATPTVADAHSRLVTPPSRSEDDFLMEGPCGGVPAGPTTAYEAGSTLTMKWATSQNHFNVFRVAFSPGDDLGFEDNVLGTRPDEVEVFSYVQDVPLPACTCDACTLQLAQFTATGKLAYYSCADIQLTAPEGERLAPCPAAEPPPGMGSSTSDDTGGTAAEDTSEGRASDTTADATSGTTANASSGSMPGTSGSDGPGEANDAAQGCNVSSDGAGHLGLFALGLVLLARRRRREETFRGTL